MTVEISLELASALDRQPEMAAMFAALAPSHRREHAGWIAQAKKAETNVARADGALAMIVEKHRSK